MKKIILLFSISFLALQTNAQYKYYRDSTYTMPFNFLTGATSVNNGVWWDDDDYEVPLGFYFKLFSDSVNKVTISLSGAGVTTTLDPLNASFITGILVSGSDLIDRDTSGLSSFSPISTNTTGTAPNRICKIEWKNAGFFNAIDNGNYEDSLDIQLWLYETSNFVEVHYGNGNYVSPNMDLYDGGPGAWFCVFDSLDINNINLNARIMYSFVGNKTSPTLDSIFAYPQNAPPGVNGNPSAGTVYRFIPKPKTNGNGGVGYNTVVSQVNFNMDFLSAQQQLRIDIFNNDDYQYIITDLNGSIINHGAISKGRKIIPTNNLANGMYLVKLYSKNENTSFKFVK